MTWDLHGLFLKLSSTRLSSAIELLQFVEATQNVRIQDIRVPVEAAPTAATSKSWSGDVCFSPCKDPSRPSRANPWLTTTLVTWISQFPLLLQIVSLSFWQTKSEVWTNFVQPHREPEPCVSARFRTATWIRSDYRPKVLKDLAGTLSSWPSLVLRCQHAHSLSVC